MKSKSYVLLLWGISACAFPKSQLYRYWIQDTAHLFSLATLTAGNQELEEIFQKYHKEIHIETFTEIPRSQLKPSATATGREVDPLLSDWEKKRLSSTGLRRIYLAIAKNPHYLLLGVGPEMKALGGFPETEKENLLSTIRPEFEASRYDEGLRESIHFFKEHFAKNKKTITEEKKIQPSWQANVIMAIGAFILLYATLFAKKISRPREI